MSIAGMAVLIVAAALLGVVVLNVAGWRRVRRLGGRGRVSLLVPARNEEANIGECLRRALANPFTEVIVCDDHSTDATAAVVRDVAATDSRVRLIHAPALAEGWCGKPHACAALSAQATGDWLLFLDADARLAPDALSRMLAECEARGLTFLSCWPELEMRGFAEKLLMPLLNFVLLTLYPAPLAASRRDASLGLAHGACILLRAAEYRALGGHGAVRDELFEDTRLARLWRESGHRGLCLDGTGTVRVRMYDSLAGIWRGFRKNLFPAFRGQRGFWAFWLLHGGVFFAPFVLWPLHWSIAASAGCVMLSRILLALRFGHPLWSALLHPLGQGVLLALGVASWWQATFGRGFEWKGRRYRGKAATEAA